MGLPTNIPSGGDGLDRFSNPSPMDDLSSPLPDVEEGLPLIEEDSVEELSEFELFQKWKQEQQSTNSNGATNAPKQSKRSSQHASKNNRSDATTARQAKTKEPEVAIEVDTDDGWAIDSKTGKRYKPLMATPKEVLAAYKKTKGAGFDRKQAMAMIEVQDDFSIDDLNGSAETFMAHLRVPPSKEEREELIRIKSEMAKKQKEAKALADAELNAKEGSIPEPEVDPFNENKNQKRGLFGRKKQNKRGE